MIPADRLRVNGKWSRSTVKWSVLGGLFVLSVIVAAVAVGPHDVARADRPYADWSWGTTADGDVVLTHDGGEAIPRETVQVLGSALDGPITDLGDGSEERLVHPFGDGTISRGDTLVIDADSLEEGDVVLYWQEPDGNQSATLAYLDYRPDVDSTPRTLASSRP